MERIENEKARYIAYRAGFFGEWIGIHPRKNQKGTEIYCLGNEPNEFLSDLSEKELSEEYNQGSEDERALDD